MHGMRGRVGRLPILRPQQGSDRQLLAAGSSVLRAEPVEQQLDSGPCIGIGNIVQGQVAVFHDPQQLAAIDQALYFAGTGDKSEAIPHGDIELPLHRIARAAQGLRLRRADGSRKEYRQNRKFPENQGLGPLLSALYTEFCFSVPQYRCMSASFPKSSFDQFSGVFHEALHEAPHEAPHEPVR